MQPSKDIIILDKDDITQNLPNEPIVANMGKKETIATNNSKINFDDIFAKSQKMTTKITKTPKIRKKDLHIPKKPQYMTMAKNAENTIQISDVKQNAIYTIQKYQTSAIFGDYVKNELKINYTEEMLNKKSVAQLESILSKIRVNLDNKGINKMYDSVLFGSTSMIENISRPIVNVDGFNKMLMENEQFLRCWERFKCGSVMPTIPSHIQMMCILAQTYFLAYAMNKPISQNSQEATEEVLKEIEEEQLFKNKKENTNQDLPVKPKIQFEMNI